MFGHFRRRLQQLHTNVCYGSNFSLPRNATTLDIHTCENCMKLRGHFSDVGSLLYSYFLPQFIENLKGLSLLQSLQFDKRLYDHKKNTIAISAAKNLRSLVTTNNFNIAALPTTLTHLKLRKFSNTTHILPQNLTHLEIQYFKGEFSLDFPPKLTHLTLNDFNKPLFGLPDTLQYLYVGDKFNQKVNNLLPLSLKTLILGYSFNKKVNNLPSSLHSLTIYGNFSRSLDNLPQNLHYFKLATDQHVVHHQSLHNLPQNLQILILSACFDHGSVLEVLPENLKILDLGGTAFMNAKGWSARHGPHIQLSPQLQYLVLPPASSHQNYTLSDFPETLKILIGGKLKKLPPNLTHYAYELGTEERPIDNKVEEWPQTLTHLSISNWRIQENYNLILPPVKVIEFWNDYHWMSEYNPSNCRIQYTETGIVVQKTVWKIVKPASIWDWRKKRYDPDTGIFSNRDIRGMFVP